MAITLTMPWRRPQPAAPTTAPNPVAEARTAAGVAFQWGGTRVEMESLTRLRTAWYPAVQHYVRNIGIFGAAVRDMAQTIADLRWSADDQEFGQGPARTDSPRWARLAECLGTLDWYRAGQQMASVGAFHIAAWPDPETILRLEMFSLTELTPPLSSAIGEPPIVVHHEGDMPAPLYPRDLDPRRRPRIVTVFRPDGEFGLSVWSPAQALLDDFEALLLMSVADKAYDLHRASGAGILFIPDSIAQVGFVPDNQVPNLMSSPAIKSIHRMITAPMGNPLAPERVVPAIITGPDDAGAKIQHFLLERTTDADTYVKRRDARWRNIALALDQPAGRVLNSEDQSKFYNTQAIDFFSMRSTVGLARLISEALLTQLFRPIMREQWLDDRASKRTLTPTWDHLQPEPDKTAEALQLFEAGLITSAYAQDMAKIPETGRVEIGSPEWRDMLEWRRAQNVAFAPAPVPTDMMGPAVPPSTGPAAPGTSPDDAAAPGDGTGAPTDGTDPLAGFDVSLSAAARIPARIAAMAADVARTAAPTIDPHLAGLGAQLTQIDLDTRAKIAGAAEHAMRACMRKLGSKLMTKGDKARKAAGDLHATPWLIPARLGPAVCAALLNADDPITGSFDDLGDQTDTWLEAALLAALLAARVDPASTAGAAALARAATARAAAVDDLRASMTELARSRVFQPGTTEVRGEAVSGLVPAGIPGRAVAIAGGAPTATVDGATRLAAAEAPPAGVATGPIVLETVANISAEPFEVDYTWRTGTPTHPFKPHHDLAGVTVRKLNDPRLASSADTSWLSVDHMHPMDHQGCQCYWSIELVPASKAPA